ncbi:hypothetical protein STEG23_006936 [Scotinomys teguina]
MLDPLGLDLQILVSHHSYLVWTGMIFDVISILPELLGLTDFIVLSELLGLAVWPCVCGSWWGQNIIFFYVFILLLFVVVVLVFKLLTNLYLMVDAGHTVFMFTYKLWSPFASTYVHNMEETESGQVCGFHGLPGINIHPPKTEHQSQTKENSTQVYFGEPEMMNLEDSIPSDREEAEEEAAESLPTMRGSKDMSSV